MLGRGATIQALCKPVVDAEHFLLRGRRAVLPSLSLHHRVMGTGEHAIIAHIQGDQVLARNPRSPEPLGKLGPPVVFLDIKHQRVPVLVIQHQPGIGIVPSLALGVAATNQELQFGLPVRNEGNGSETEPHSRPSGNETTDDLGVLPERPETVLHWRGECRNRTTRKQANKHQGFLQTHLLQLLVGDCTIPERLLTMTLPAPILLSFTKGIVAQRLEQGTHNPRVVGPNPAGPKHFQPARRSE